MLQAVMAFIGGVVMVLALVGFVRSIWRPRGSKDGAQGYSDGNFSDPGDTGGHGGGDGGGGGH